MSWIDLQAGILELFAELHHKVDRHEPGWTWSDRDRKRCWRRRQANAGRCDDCATLAAAGRKRCRRHLAAARDQKRRIVAADPARARQKNREAHRRLRRGIVPQRELVAARRSRQAKEPSP